MFVLSPKIHRVTKRTIKTPQHQPPSEGWPATFACRLTLYPARMSLNSARDDRGWSSSSSGPAVSPAPSETSLFQPAASRPGEDESAAAREEVSPAQATPTETVVGVKRRRARWWAGRCVRGQACGYSGNFGRQTSASGCRPESCPTCLSNTRSARRARCRSMTKCGRVPLQRVVGLSRIVAFLRSWPGCWVLRRRFERLWRADCHLVGVMGAGRA
jgi:hypothetical protein